MRLSTRGGRAALALLAGLLVGAWAGGGLVWVLNRSKYKDPNTVADVSLPKAEELELIPADASGFIHVRAASIWKTEALADAPRSWTRPATTPSERWTMPSNPPHPRWTASPSSS
jgi:hypothetical protein